MQLSCAAPGAIALLTHNSPKDRKSTVTVNRAVNRSPDLFAARLRPRVKSPDNPWRSKTTASDLSPYSPPALVADLANFINLRMPHFNKPTALGAGKVNDNRPTPACHALQGEERREYGEPD
jgi:hypothetical protein